MAKRLLLLSNSRNPGQEFLAHAEDTVRDFFGSIGSAVFAPFAGVTLPFGPYTDLVRKHFGKLGIDITSLHETNNPVGEVKKAEAILVGGGNTFHLLHHLYKLELLDAIRERVTGGAPYMGWSAGSNVACPTIKTTNDMPIIEPPSLDALGLVSFQINPHYLDANPKDHGGETREQRILEFIEVNPETYVAGLREGTLLRIEETSVELIGERPMRVFKKGTDPREYEAGESLELLRS